MHFWSKYLP